MKSRLWLSMVSCSLALIAIGFIGWWASPTAQARPLERPLSSTIWPGGTLVTNTTWTLAGSPYLVQGGIKVPAGITLTIQPGVEVRFAPGYDYLDVQNGGMFSAQGTAGQPITFTSDSTSPQPGDWYGLYQYAGGRLSLNHCTIDYGGWGGAAGLNLYGSDAQVQNCTIQHTLGTGIYLGTNGMTPTLQNVAVLTSTGRAIYQGAVDMQPTYQNLTLSGNGEDALVVAGGGLAHDLTLDGPAALNGRPIHMLGQIALGNSATLTITPGTEVRFPPGTHFSFLDVENGSTLNAQGTAAQPITFTSAATSPQPGDWYGLYQYAGGRLVLNHCTIDYGGYESNQALTLYGSEAQVQNCTIQHTLGTGIYLGTNGMTPTLQNVAVLTSTGRAIYQGAVDMQPTYQNLTLNGNGEDALVVAGGGLAHDLTLDGPAALNGRPIHMLGQIALGNSATLTITPGTEVRFPPGTHFSFLDVENGSTLNAQGTAAQPITFTSAATSPQPGDWYGLYQYAGGRLVLNHCTIDYGGYESNQALTLYGSEAQVQNCTIQHTLGTGIYLGTNGMTPTLQNVAVLTSTGRAIYQGAVDMQPTYQNLTLNGNGEDALVVAGGGLAHDLTLDGSPAVLNGRPIHMLSTVDINNGATFTVTAGTEMRFAPGNDFLEVESGSTLNAQGTAAQPITFTSALTNPQPGDWYGLYQYPGGRLSLNHCTIDYGGYSDNKALMLNSLDAQVQNCIIRDTNGTGIDVSNAGLTLSGNQIYSNTAGVVNTTPAIIVDARNNWWGDASGPYHPTKNPGGKGNRVSDGVLFSPWLHTSNSDSPILLTPPNGTLTTTQAITLAWQAGAGGTPLGYNVQVDGSIITTTDTTSATVLSTGVHTWTVRAYDAVGYSDWASAWAVEITQPVGIPILLAPPDGTVTTTHPITFVWQAGAGSAPTGYNVQVDGIVITTTNPTSATVLSNGIHNWTVRAYNATGYSAWVSPTRTITVQGYVQGYRVFLPLVHKNYVAGMVFIPTSNFQMGCDPSHNEGYSCDGDNPLHTVYLDTYWIDQNLVTNAQYMQCVAAGSCTVPYTTTSATRSPYYGNATFANYPVIWMTWNQASAFCTWAGKRLPTEAEWEKAARGNSDTRAYPWGDQAPTCTLANFNNNNNYCVGDTSAVGSYPSGASPYGVLDMAGNVWEWVNDWYGRYYYSSSPLKNPSGPDTGTLKVLRGGSWYNGTAYFTRMAFRNYIGYPPYLLNYVGFRCAATPGK